MTKMETIAYLFEDVFSASVFWNEDKSVLKIFVDNLEDCDLRSMILDAAKRPYRVVPDSEKTCVPHFEVGFIELRAKQELDGEKIYLPNQGYIPYDLASYMDYLLGNPMLPDEYAQVKDTLRIYFDARNEN